MSSISDEGKLGQLVDFFFLFNTVTEAKEVRDRLTSCSLLNGTADDSCCEMEIRASSLLGISQCSFLIHSRWSAADHHAGTCYIMRGQAGEDCNLPVETGPSPAQPMPSKKISI